MTLIWTALWIVGIAAKVFLWALIVAVAFIVRYDLDYQRERPTRTKGQSSMRA